MVPPDLIVNKGVPIFGEPWLANEKRYGVSLLHSGYPGATGRAKLGLFWIPLVQLFQINIFDIN